MTHVPSERATVPGMIAAKPPGRAHLSTAPRWLEHLRGPRWFMAIRLLVDVLSAVCAVALAHATLPAGIDNRHVLAYSWAFVPFVILVLSTRSLYKRKLNFKFLEDLEPMETGVAVAALGHPDVADVGGAAFSARPGRRRRTSAPADLIIRIWVCAAILMPALRAGQIPCVPLPSA